jgi:hypothetical protein
LVNTHCAFLSRPRYRTLVKPNWRFITPHMLNPGTDLRLIAIRRLFRLGQFAVTAVFFLCKVFRVRSLFIRQFFLPGIRGIASNLRLTTMQ